MEFTYQSPLDGDAGLGCQTDGEMTVWTFGGVAVAMLSMRASWTRAQRAWYAARRDAGLLGACPICGAPLPPRLPNGFGLGAMIHDDNCALVDPRWMEGMYLAWAD